MQNTCKKYTCDAKLIVNQYFECFCSCIKISRATLSKLMGLLSKIVNYLHKFSFAIKKFGVEDKVCTLLAIPKAFSVTSFVHYIFFT